MKSAFFARALLAAALAVFAAPAIAAEPDSPEAIALQNKYLGESAASANVDTLRTWFHEAPAKIHDGKLSLKGLPLWHTNGELSDEKIREIFGEGQKNGFGGITFLPLTKTTPTYLSDEYLKQYGKMLDVADELGMPVIFYDDVDFPSGMAGGKLKEQFPEATIKRLDKVEWIVKGPAEFSEKSSIPFTEKVLFGKEGGILQAAVALNTATNERINIRDAVDAEGNVKWSVPEGEWKIMLFVCVSDPKGLVDYMSPESVKKFFSLTYDRIYDLFPEHFGTTLKAIFFDDITNTQTQNSRNWALEFNDKYRELWNSDPDLDYPALFYPIGKDAPSARYRLWTTRNRLFADGYPGLVKKWKDAHNLDMISTGHPQGPYIIQPIDMCGDAMATHKGSDAVLFDSIHYYGHGRDGFKVPTSAAYNYDFPLCFVEIYGNYRDPQFTAGVMLRSAMEIFARGGNLLLPHGVWSDPETVYIPPEISWRNPRLQGGFLPKYGDYVSRCSMLLQGGRHVADFGMLYPVDNLKAFFHFQFDTVKGDYPYGLLIPEETDYLGVGSDFTSRIWRDFTFLHPQVIDEKCKVVKKEDGSVRFRLENVSNWEEYRALVIPGVDVISLANLKKFAEFYDAGGALLATTRLPSVAAEGPEFNDQVCEIVQRIFGVDPRTQAPNKAIKTGQEDIVLPENFVNCREINKAGEYVPERPDNLVKYEEPIRRERAVFLPRPTVEALQDAADYLVPKPDVLVKAAEGTEIPYLNVVPRWVYEHEGMLQYIHKVKNGTDVWLFANSANEAAEFTATLRGLYEWVDLWDPWTGETTRISGTDQVTVNTDEGTTSVKLKLDSIKSVFILAKSKD